jgi:glyoxylase I family protein
MMEKVTGIGGFFFRAQKPDELANWYTQNLGINPAPPDYDTPSWQQQAGSTVFAPFEAATDYFGKAEQQWMINFRVRDLNAMVEQLRKNGITVTVDEQTYPNGRFAQLNDPEGNPIQLWQAAGADVV